MEDITQRIINFNSHFREDLAQLKFKSMTENAFRFFRGTCHIFYQDLKNNGNLPDSPTTWISGDLHIENFGSYKGDNGLVYFDMNDFDESVLSPVLLDITRMITSIYVAFDSLKITHKETEDAVVSFLKHFTNTLKEGSARYIDPQTATGIVKKFLTAVGQRKEVELLQERTVRNGNRIKLVKGKEKELKLSKQLKKELVENFNAWMVADSAPLQGYRLMDVSFRVAGTGSIGVERYLFLIRKENEQKKYRFIDMKQALPSSILPFTDIPQPSWQSEAERIVSVQKRMQNISPAQLSTNFFKENSYVMEEMQPTKDRINFEVIDHNFKQVCCVLNDMAIITASSYLSASGRQGSAIADDLITFAERNDWQDWVIGYAKEYKNKVTSDYQAFKLNIHKV